MGAKKRDKLPKGVGRVPEWWLEITPHNTLFLEDDEARRYAEKEEAKRFEKLAALQDLMDKYGGEDFPDWNPATDGPRTKEEEEEWVSKGYKRNEKEEWVSEEGAPLEGRQFKGQMPPGYSPGNHVKDDGADGAGLGKGNLKSNGGKYERDAAKAWDKPDWMKVKLRSTGTGGAVRNGDAVDRPITKGDGKVVTREKSSDDADPVKETDDAAQTEDTIIQEGREVGNIKSSADFKPRATGELQAILNRRKQASD